jgi:hypothetical protein
MDRCLIFIASLFLAFVAISSTATATPSEWRHASQTVFTADDVPGEGPGAMASWATVPPPRPFTFVAIQL